MLFLRRTRVTPLFVLALGLALSACDNPVGRGGEHPSAIRVRSEAGVQVASFRVGGAVIGEISAVVGTPVTFTLEVLDRNDTPVVIDGSYISVVPTVTGGVVTVVIQQNDRLVVTPTQAGTGQVNLQVMHSGHTEFTARIPITVSAMGTPN
jgi:hypothetical protein